MNINITRAEAGRLESYTGLFSDCVLHDRYFSGESGRLRLCENIMPAVERGDSAFEARDSAGQTVGLICVDWSGMLGAFPYIQLLGVSSAARGMGVGSRLLDKVLLTAREAGFDRIFICVTEGNPRAKRLYVSKGFKKIALVDSLFLRGVSENILMKLL